MRTLGLTVRQIRYEQKIFWRTPAAVFFTFAFPILLLVIFATLNRGQHLDLLGGIPFAQYYVPAMGVFGVVSACYGNFSARFVFRRESGLLKRTRATPLPLGVLLAGFAANAVIVSMLVVALSTVVGVAAYHVSFPGRWVALSLTLVCGAAAFCALGLALTCAIPNVDAADPMIYATLMPALFISGGFFPVASSSALGRLSEVLPVRHLIAAAFASFDPRAGAGGGGGVAWGDLAVVAAWGLAAALVAVRGFRWEPGRH